MTNEQTTKDYVERLTTVAEALGYSLHRQAGKRFGLWNKKEAKWQFTDLTLFHAEYFLRNELYNMICNGYIVVHPSAIVC